MSTDTFVYVVSFNLRGIIETPSGSFATTGTANLIVTGAAHFPTYLENKLWPQIYLNKVQQPLF